MNAHALLLLVLLAPALASAQSPQACPWLTAGTAGRILGGEVQVTVKTDSNWSGYCIFVTAAIPVRSIEIRVGKTHTHACGGLASTPLAGIGNQAVLCSARDSSGREVRTVSGHVRDTWFAVTLAAPSTPGGPEPSTSESTASPAIEFLAEQVAGNLY